MEYAVHAVGDWQQVLYQMTSGLAHLHSKQVIHGHLKPKNILVSCADRGVPPMIKLANFGIVKRTSPRNGNPVSLWKLGGFKGWLPAEAYDKTQFTTEMDVFALGLLFGYSLNKGCHPFGEDKDRRIVRIKKSEPMILTANQLQNVTDPVKVFQLINCMLSSTPSMRPTATRVLMDTYFSSITAQESQGVIYFVNTLFILKSNEEFLYLIVAATSRKLKQEDIDDDEILIIAEYSPQSKRAKRT